jgi:hypothetical protein
MDGFRVGLVGGRMIPLVVLSGSLSNGDSVLGLYLEIKISIMSFGLGGHLKAKFFFTDT